MMTLVGGRRTGNSTPDGERRFWMLAANLRARTREGGDSLPL